jgi:hypothetical protein
MSSNTMATLLFIRDAAKLEQNERTSRTLRA